MTATSIFFNGQLIFKPGSYSLVDASGLATQGLGANGIVAILGTAQGGRPYTATPEKVDFVSFSRPGKEGEEYISGDLFEAVPMLFEPSNDPDIPGGAQLVYAMKVNPDTQSTATFANGSGDSLILTSTDYGAHNDQISVVIATGTTQGKRVVVTLEDLVQTIDDVGGSAFFTCIYRPQSGAGGVGWEAMTMEVLSGGQLRANGSFNNIGGATQVTAGIQSALTVVSANAGDVGQVVTIYGLVAGVPTRVQATLNGTTPVATTPASVFDAGSVFGAIMSGVAVGNVTIRDSAVTVLLTITAGAVQTAAVKMSSFFINGALTQVADAANANFVWYVGRNAAGSIVIDRLQLNGTTPVVSAVTTLTTLEAIVIGEVPNARTITVTGRALQSTVTVQTTLQKLADYVNARQVANTPDPWGFEFEITTPRTTFAVSQLDRTLSPVNIFSPTVGSFFADLQELIDGINNGMDLVTAAAAPGAIGVPNNTVNPVFLSGGTDAVASANDWQAALNLLKKARVNTIVPLTHDPAIHAMVVAHCNFMAGIGRSERDAVVGLQNAGLNGLADRSEIRDQILDLNTRHLRAVAQSVDRFDHTGELTEFDPKFHACLVAGAQAGSPVGTPLTFKQVNCLGFHQDSDWNPVDDAEEMIQLGLMFMEEVDGIGRRWVRNITTNVGSSNIAFTEASVNQAVNFSVFNFRTNMEVSVGKKGFSGTINAAKAVALNTLGLLVDNQILTQFRALAIDLILDVLEVSVEIAPVIPINFVRNVLHLVTAAQAAA